MALDADASVVANNIIYNVGDGIRDAGQVVNNIISNVTGNHISGGNDVHHNLLWQNGSPTSVSGVTCNDCVEADPMLMFLGGSVVGMKAESPAVDAGSATNVYQTFWDTYLSLFTSLGSSLESLDIAKDFRGERRPRDGNGDGTSQWDVGAFEGP